jgi:DNA-binding CsgD family transcriptional regulator
LTVRQAQVAKLAAMGATTEEIAADLGIPANTVGSHMRDVKRKTGMGKFELTRWVFDQLREILR